MIRDLKSGSEKAFKTVFEQYGHKVFFVCQRIGLSQEDAEDVVQETFLQLWNQRHSIDEKKGVAGLIKIIAKRTAIKKAETNHHLDRQMLERIGDIVSPVIEVEETEVADLHLLRHLIELLPARSKSVLKMHYYEGMTAKEISQVHATSPRTVENLLYRTKKSLREQLASRRINTYVIMILWSWSEYVHEMMVMAIR